MIDSTLTMPVLANLAVIDPLSDSVRTTALDYSFNWSSNTDSAVFEITTVLSPDTKDTIRKNDTLKYFQRFYNYYAYDDGTAEASYGLNSAGAKLAYQFTTVMTDTLRAVDMYFVQSKYDQSEEFFYLTIWSSLTPETIVYQQKFEKPEYEDSLNKFHTYLLDEIVVLSGNYYVGWLQESDEELGIGIDFNREAGALRWYNTSGTWLQSLLGGAIMIRPLFGDTVVLPLTIEEQEEAPVESLGNLFNVFPNPANDVIRVQLQGQAAIGDIYQISIVDMYGRVVVSESNTSGLVDIRHLSDGIYFVKVGVYGSEEFETKKIFVAH
ncbi:MAG: T9SS type A sorting domain-containing protein [Flavobacteriales bacterium]|nr:T9SS type A sorting domain-containing protein [Flavobacteriales bacterium]